MDKYPQAASANTFPNHDCIWHAFRLKLTSSARGIRHGYSSPGAPLCSLCFALPDLICESHHAFRTLHESARCCSSASQDPHARHEQLSQLYLLSYNASRIAVDLSTSKNSHVVFNLSHLGGFALAPCYRPAGSGRIRATDRQPRVELRRIITLLEPQGRVPVMLHLRDAKWRNEQHQVEFTS
jgi:hypothetical protein